MKLNLTGSWKLRGESQKGEGIFLGYIKSNLDDADWIVIPKLMHLQTILCEDNPYFGEKVRAINDKAWWYRKRFYVPGNYRGKTLRLRFEGADYYTSVYLNGNFLGHHIGHFNPFEFDITDQVFYESENVLVVRVRAPWDEPNIYAERRTSDTVIRQMVKGLYEHADELIPPVVNPIGLWQPVSLVASGPVVCERVAVFSRILDEKEVEVNLEFTLHNYTSSPQRVDCQLTMEGETFEEILIQERFSTLASSGQSSLKKTYRLKDPRLWWPWDQGTPHLHRLLLKTSTDSGATETFTKVIGIREVKLIRTPEETSFIINGRKVFIRGTLYIPDIYLSRMNLEKYKEDMERVKDSNSNLIRLHVHVDRPELYDLCDRMGIMVYQDFELNWAHPATLEWEEQAVSLFKEMINMLQAYPSIICWCCHNEPVDPPCNYHEHPDPRLYKEALKLDPSRPVFQGSGRAEDYQHSGDSHNYLGSLSEGEYTDILKAKERLNTEYGVGAPPDRQVLEQYPILYNRLKNALPRIEELQEYQCQLLKFYTEYYRYNKFNPCSGCVQVQFIDCWIGTFFGVIDYHRNKKKAYQVLRDAFQPLLICFEYGINEPKAIWAVNDLPKKFLNVTAEWKVTDTSGKTEVADGKQLDIPINTRKKVCDLTWKVKDEERYTLELSLKDSLGKTIAANRYVDPFHPMRRPKGYPEGFDFYLGIKTFEPEVRNTKPSDLSLALLERVKQVNNSSDLNAR